MKTGARNVHTSGNKTNHSLRPSSIIQAGISEKVIQDGSVHQPLDGLRKYEKEYRKNKRHIIVG